MESTKKRTKRILSAEEIKKIENILRTWGTLTLLESGGSLSFLSENALQNLSKFGIKISGGKKEVCWPTTVECADQLINQLSKYKPKWAQAIKWHYTEPDSLREQAERHHLGKSNYHEQIVNGRTWIAEHLKNSLH